MGLPKYYKTKNINMIIDDASQKFKLPNPHGEPAHIINLPPIIEDVDDDGPPPLINEDDLPPLEDDDMPPSLIDDDGPIPEWSNWKPNPDEDIDDLHAQMVEDSKMNIITGPGNQGKSLININTIMEMTGNDKIFAKELVSDNKMTLIKLKPNKNFIAMITNDLFSKDKMILTQNSYVYKNIKMINIIPGYKFANNITDRLLLQTEFIDIDENPISLTKYDTYKISSEAFSIETLEILKYYEIEFDKYMKVNFPNYKVRNNFLRDYNNTITEFYPGMNIKIPAKLKKDHYLGQYSGKIYNYNVSKKYKPTQEFEFSDYKKLDLKTMYYCKKQARFLVCPISYICESNKTYGTHLNIYTIEIKYPGAKIRSVFDGQDTVENEVINISI